MKTQLLRGQLLKYDTSPNTLQNCYDCRKSLEQDLQQLEAAFSYQRLVAALEKSKLAKTKWNDNECVNIVNKAFTPDAPIYKEMFEKDVFDRFKDCEDELYKICLYSINIKMDEDFLKKIIEKSIRVISSLEKITNIIETLISSNLSNQAFLDRFCNNVARLYSKHRLDDKNTLQQLSINAVCNIFIINTFYRRDMSPDYISNILLTISSHKALETLRVEKALSLFDCFTKFGPSNTKNDKKMRKTFHQLSNVMRRKTNQLYKLLQLDYYELIITMNIKNKKIVLDYLSELCKGRNKQVSVLNEIPYFAKYLYYFLELNGHLANQFAEADQKFLDTLMRDKSLRVHNELNEGFSETTLFGQTSKDIGRKNSMEKLLSELGLTFRQEAVINGFLVDIQITNFNEFILRHQDKINTKDAGTAQRLLNCEYFVIEIDGKYHKELCGDGSNYFSSYKRVMLSKNSKVISLERDECLKIINDSSPIIALENYLIDRLS